LDRPLGELGREHHADDDQRAQVASCAPVISVNATTIASTDGAAQGTGRSRTSPRRHRDQSAEQREREPRYDGEVEAAHPERTYRPMDAGLGNLVEALDHSEQGPAGSGWRHGARAGGPLA